MNEEYAVFWERISVAIALVSMLSVVVVVAVVFGLVPHFLVEHLLSFLFAHYPL